MLKTFTFSIIAVCLLTLLPTSQVYAASGVGRIVHTYGPAWIQRGDTREKVRKGRVVLRNDSIITGPRGRVKLIMGDGSKVYIGAKSRISLRKYSLRGKKLLNASINMLWGKARFFVNKLASRDASFRVQTSTAVLGVRGTEFSVWVPPTHALLSQAFDNITLADIPPLPTRTVLMEGAVDVDNGSGIQYRLTPGNTADVDSDRKMQVRKTNNEDLEENSQPLGTVSNNTDANEADAPESQKQPQATLQTADTETDDAKPENEGQQSSSQDEPKTETQSESQPEAKKQPHQADSKSEPTADDQPQATSPDGTQDNPKKPETSPQGNAQQPNAPSNNPQGNPSTQPVANALPDNPQPSDAASIMFGDAAAGLADQPTMPAPPAVAAPLVMPNAGDLPGSGNGQTGNGQASGNGQNPNETAPNNAPPPATNPLLGSLPGGAIPIDTQATTNAIQNLGTATDIQIKPNFVKP